jgi:hypothetical protein
VHEVSTLILIELNVSFTDVGEEGLYGLWCNFVCLYVPLTTCNSTDDQFRARLVAWPRLGSHRPNNFRPVWLPGLSGVVAQTGSQSTIGLGPRGTLGSIVSSGAGKSRTWLMQKRIFDARAEMRMEMAGTTTRISKKRKGGRDGFRHLPLCPISPIFNPSSTVPPNFELLLPSASK